MAEPEPRTQTDALTGKRVLTVEDEGITQLQLGKILKSAGMTQVGMATSGPQGVALALLEAARRILAEYQTCILMLTAYTDYAAQAVEIGARGYILKPIDRITLLHRIRQALDAFESG
jgi:AmiR/NasT family two-component response regulator